MASRSTGGATLEVEKASALNLKKQMKQLEKNSDNAFKGVVKLLFQIKLLAQQKLKSDKHIVTSRLRNSLYVQTPGQKFANQPDNRGTYSDNKGMAYDAEMKGIGLKDNEGAVGTNVIYSASIEYDHDSYLYWAMKNADVDRMGRDIAKELLNGVV